MRRRVLSLLLALAMVLSLVPTMAWAADAEIYNVWVNGEQFASNKLTILCGTGTAAYDPDTKTVTLNGAQITSGYYDGTRGGAIYAQGDLTVNVIGESSIKPGESEGVYGIYTYGNLVLTGTDKLEIVTNAPFCYGIFVEYGGITVNMDGRLMIDAADSGIFADYEAKLCGKGAVSVTSVYSGISARSIEISGSGNVDVISNSDGLSSTHEVTISGSGNVSVSSGAIGILARSNVVLSGGGTVTIYGKNNGIRLRGTGSKLLLNGTSTPISVSTEAGKQAVYNRDTGESPVAGTNRDRYEATGDPASNSVVYTYEGEPYDLWVNGERVTEAKKDDVLGDGTVAFNPTTNTLTLNNAQLTNTYMGGAIMSEHPLNVNVIGNSSIVLDSDTDSNGIHIYGDLALTGTGNLEIRVEKDYYNGIYVRNGGNLTVNMDGELTITAGYAGISADGDVSISGSGDVTVIAGGRGIYADKNLTISGGNVTVNAGYEGVFAYYGDLTLSGEGDLSVTSKEYGIYARSENVLISGSGYVEVISTDDDGIHACKDVRISGSREVIVHADDDGIYSYDGDILITDSSYVTAYGDYSGIQSYCGYVTISGSSNVTVISNYYAFFADIGMTISTSGDVTAEAGDYGVATYYDSVILSGSGRVDIYGGEHAVYIHGDDSKVHLNGTASPITLKTGSGNVAVWNGTTEESPVTGTNFVKYYVSGDPASDSVVYALTDPETLDCGGDPDSCVLTHFIDAPKYTNWAHKGIEYCVVKGLMSGTSSITFQPNLAMNRAMLVTVLYHMEGEPDAGSSSFSDVKTSAWYYRAVSWASTKGIVNGVGNNKFNPNGPVTREQLALILYNYSKMQGCDVSGGVTLAGFADQSKVSAWAFDAMSWAVGEGLLSGTIKNGQPYLQPKASATRAQVATILMAYITQYLRK